MKRIVLMGIVMALAVLLGAGCSSTDQVKDGDRGVVWMTDDAARQGGEAAAAAKATLPPAGEVVDEAGRAKAVVLLQFMQQAYAETRKNCEQLLANWGGRDAVPKEYQKAYTPADAEAMRKVSAEQHERPWWQLALGGVVSFLLGGGAVRLLARFAPALAGPVGIGLQAVIEAIALARSKAEQNGGSIKATDLLEILFRRQKDAGVQPYVAELAESVEKKMGVSLGLKL